MYEIEIRVPRRTAILALAGGLLCALWRISLSQRMDNMWSGDPAGAYSGVIVTGWNATGPVDSSLAAGAGNMLRLGSAAGNGTQAKFFSAAPLLGVAVGGGAAQMAAPPLVGGAALAFNSRGASSGVGVMNQATPPPGAPPDTFRIYPSGGNLAFNFNDAPDSAPTNQISSTGFATFCRLVSVTWGATTSCDDSTHFGYMGLGDVAQDSAVATGQMICCKVGLKQ